MDEVREILAKHKLKLNKREVAEYTGLSVHQINRLITRKAIPHYKIGLGSRAPVRFDRLEIDKWYRRFMREVAA